MSTVVEVEDLRKRYGDTVAVDGVSLQVQAGEIFGVLGRNGAGKTTTVESIAGLRKPDAGRIRVLGLDPRRDRARVRQVLGVQLQQSAVHFSLTVRELVRLFRSFYRTGRDPDDLIEVLGLGGRRDTRFEELSGGQQQRLSIALALVGSPRVAILDELTTGLDPEARRGIWTLIEDIRDAGTTVILVSHAMEEVERLCDQVAILDRGRVIAQDAPAGLVAGAGLGQRVRFVTTTPERAAVLLPLAEVDRVDVDGDHVEVTGTGDLLHVVSETLVRHGVVATGTRSETAGLDEAFLALVGRQFDSQEQGADR